MGRCNESLEGCGAEIRKMRRIGKARLSYVTLDHYPFNPKYKGVYYDCLVGSYNTEGAV